MSTATAGSDLERRKKVRIRLRPDLVIETQKYEGRTYYVLKDPVSLRYYRIKEYERFLLGYFDGVHTLEDAQEAYERSFRPDRLRLEDLEAFVQQLLLAGLVHNESPRAGRQLFERRKKRVRSELVGKLTNILYVKVPLIDPDRILTWMSGHTRWIFTSWFFFFSLMLMGSAALLVVTRFETFRSRLPNYHEFFRFETLIYLWVALAVVKVIHEFGHGLSCKHYGGEVHEMGLLFLCLSPAMYCNVTDSWKLPNKWHRIIISGAGIYVELVIAALATFVWWNTPTSPFIHNLSLSLMAVCSVSTFVFNANPLMRFDGYYMLADWLEIPNLRERSNRFLSQTVLKHCLGVEVMQEGYMARWRRILFITYAITSWLYRWLVTFTILWFLYHFLRPYKLEVISGLLAVMALVSLVGVPFYRLCRNIHRRGRLPDMKRWRVVLTSSFVVGLFLFVCFVPVPISRIRGVGLVQPHPDAFENVRIRYPGILEYLSVREGQSVQEGDVLARLTSQELDTQLTRSLTEAESSRKMIDYLSRQRELTSDLGLRGQLDLDMSRARSELSRNESLIGSLEKIKQAELVIRAPRTGIATGVPPPEGIGKFFDHDAVFCRIIEPRRVQVWLPVFPDEWQRLKQNVEPLSPAAAATHQQLLGAVSLSWEGVPLRAALDALRRKHSGLHLRIDPDAGIPQEVLDAPVRLAVEKQPARHVLHRLFQPHGLGYVVVSEPGRPLDGWIVIRPGEERGYPLGFQPQVDLPVTVRVQGRDSHTWQGKLLPLPESEAGNVPLEMSSRAGGPVAIKAGGSEDGLVPQTQTYLVQIDVTDPDNAIIPGQLAQVKISCKPETCLHWAWRTVNQLFDLGLW